MELVSRAKVGTIHESGCFTLEELRLVLSMAIRGWNSLDTSHIFQFSLIWKKKTVYALYNHAVMQTNEWEVKMLEKFSKIWTKAGKPPHWLKKHITYFQPKPSSNIQQKKWGKRKSTSLFSTCCNIFCVFWCINEVGSLHLKGSPGVLHM